MKNNLIALLAFLLLCIVGCSSKKSTSWTYIGSYYCNYDVFQPEFYQTKTSVEVYFKPGQGNVVIYGVKDDSGSIMATWAGPSSMLGSGTVIFHNFRRGNEVGVVTLKISDLPYIYWPQN